MSVDSNLLELIRQLNNSSGMTEQERSEMMAKGEAIADANGVSMNDLLNPSIRSDIEQKGQQAISELQNGDKTVQETLQGLADLAGIEQGSNLMSELADVVLKGSEVSIGEEFTATEPFSPGASPANKMPEQQLVSGRF